ncbi:MAG: Biopolymer transport protein ExbD [Acinetobacter bereziniae]|uniref:Biopolymer transport protein ExbD n=1 Tax=Acinetobacter bereziniae TaxID=106648 RepID=A0A833PBX6_ACIBZ|nr:MAG: Biopolymer transport protein ExbD [Acinetobacter bereziniae]
MAFSSRKKKITQNEVISEINVTPFIDVMLVLLIVFMVVAPLSTVNVPLDLPKSNSQVTQSDAEPIVVSINEKLEIFIGDTGISKDLLAKKLTEKTKGDKEKRIYIQAAKAVPYNSFMELVNTLAKLGYSKVALVGEPQ